MFVQVFLRHVRNWNLDQVSVDFRHLPEVFERLLGQQEGHDHRRGRQLDVSRYPTCRGHDGEEINL